MILHDCKCFVVLDPACSSTIGTEILCRLLLFRKLLQTRRRTVTAVGHDDAELPTLQGERLHPRHVNAKERLETYCQLRETCAVVYLLHLVASCYSLCSLCPRRVGKDQDGRNMPRSMCYTKTIIRLSCFIWTHGIFGLELILPRLFSAQDRVKSTVPKVKQTKTHQTRQHLAISDLLMWGTY